MDSNDEKELHRLLDILHDSLKAREALRDNDCLTEEVGLHALRNVSFAKQEIIEFLLGLFVKELVADGVVVTDIQPKEMARKIMGVRAEMQNVYEMAKGIVEQKQSWQPGETVTVWESKDGSKRVTINEQGRDGGGLLFLRAFRGEEELAHVQCGHLNPMLGWRWALTEGEYFGFVSRVTGKSSPVNGLPVEMCKDCHRKPAILGRIYCLDCLPR